VSQSKDAVVRSETKTDRILFNSPWMCGRELEYIRQAADKHHLSGNGHFTRMCHSILEKRIGINKAFLTHSGTAALEMAALIADIQPGDEIIMPSYTFVTTASAFVMRGAIPVFVDIRNDNLNLDENLIEQAITPKTKAIVVVHYAGFCCEMRSILEIAKKHNLLVIEDAAHALGSEYHGKQAGSFGHLSALSFHETKNVISGEGGALLVNDESMVDRAYMVWEKGTNRTAFYEGLVDKYTWQVLGSSFPASDIIAAFLLAQLESIDVITQRRRAIWQVYHNAFEDLEKQNLVRRPILNDEENWHNGHMYFLILNSQTERQQMISFLGERNISAVFHYVPLHSSPAGQKFGRAHGDLVNTDTLSAKLIRLPLWMGLKESDIERTIEGVKAFFKR